MVRGTPDHRTNIGGRIVRIAGSQFLCRGDKQVEEFFVNRRFHDHPLRRNALLSTGLESRGGDALCRIGKICVGADDIGGVGSQLGNELLCARGARQILPGGCSARECDSCDLRMSHKRQRGLASAGDHIEHSVGQTGAFQRFGNDQRGFGRGR